jgi:TfoX/Sxy family transcriptional regulator of competence genes
MQPTGGIPCEVVPLTPMKMETSPPELERRFDEAFPDDPRAERRKMFGYVTVPRAIVDDAERLREWLQRALEYGASLPAKEKKPPRAKKASR